ncbi:hypothetical protein H5410_048006 [Solanum commersonii]|uniref:Uncharacterized protein n=1 Tax=Solanum commersonii TaxID=4109 RepID=A0A9J5XJW6_SOLCO|nr:hypothetical protein H5410_048006 [Solanum commersonii]
MGKNQTIIKDTQSQGQGVCEKIFKSLHLTSIFRYFSRNPKSKIATSDHHHRNDPAKATELKLVVTQKDQITSNKVPSIKIIMDMLLTRELEGSIAKILGCAMIQDELFRATHIGKKKNVNEWVETRAQEAYLDWQCVVPRSHNSVNDDIS